MRILIFTVNDNFEDEEVKEKCKDCVGCMYQEKHIYEKPCNECCNSYLNMYEEKKEEKKEEVSKAKRYTLYHGDFKKARKDFEEYCYPRPCQTCTLCDYRQDNDCYSIWLMQEIEV